MAEYTRPAAVFDARTLGKPKMLLLGFQHMFAMFGATVLVPALLESSFAFIGGYAAVVEIGAALILVLAIGINYGPGSIVMGKISLSGLAVAALVGIIMNAFLPGKDYEFGKNRRADISVNLGGSTRHPNWRQEHPEDADYLKK